MIAYVLSRLGRDPAFAIGGDVPQLGGNAGTGEGWFVVEGDESDRTIAALRPRVAVVLNVELDHHTEFASLAELNRCSTSGFARPERRARGRARTGRLRPRASRAAQPAERRSRSRRTRALRCHARRSGAAPRAVPRRRAAFRVARRGTRRPCVRRLRPPSDRDRRDTRNRTRSRRATRPRSLPASPVLADAAPCCRVRGRASSADVVAVTDVYRARERPIDGVSGKLIVDEIRDARVAWMPSSSAAPAGWPRSRGGATSC